MFCYLLIRDLFFLLTLVVTCHLVAHPVGSSRGSWRGFSSIRVRQAKDLANTALYESMWSGFVYGSLFTGCFYKPILSPKVAMSRLMLGFTPNHIQTIARMAS